MDKTTQIPGADRTPDGRHRGGRRQLASLATALSLALICGAAAPAPEVLPARGFVTRTAGDVLSQEAVLLGVADGAHARRWAERLGASPRIAGTAGGASTALWLAERFRGWGLETEVHGYDVYLPHATAARVTRLTPTRVELPLEEPALAGDPDASDGHYPAAAGYSAAGEFAGPVVYANYGTKGDFAALELMGVDVADAVVLMRFGQIFRGMKVGNAEAAGAGAVLLYSDPAEDGFPHGEVYPGGPFRPGTALQRGSVKIGAPGDPTTPGRPSLPGAERSSPEGVAAGLPSIPVIALGYDAAATLLGEMRGTRAPATWHGALELPYYLGGGEVRAEVVVRLDDRPIKRILNPVATLRGSQFPDEWVIIGAHFDSWTNGAVDNVSGTAALLEVARTLGALQAAGIRPRRSIVLAAWDGEEWGLLGSAEWAEQYASELAGGAVAYLNLDGIAGGPYFQAMASPSLARALREVTSVVPDPVEPATSVLQGWALRSGSGTSGEPPVALPGGGSDHASFFGRLGVPSASFGFGGAAGVYHSAYDTSAFMRRFGDPGYRQHTAVAAMTALFGWRLANADVLPFDYRDYGRFLSGAARPLARSGLQGLEMGPLLTAITRFNLAAAVLEQRATHTLSGAAPVGSAMALANRHLIRVERRLTHEAGLPGRPWYRNVVVAPHPDNAYVVSIFPGLWGALGGGSAGDAGEQLHILVEAIRAATRELEAARRFLGSAPLHSAD
jgi:N-acetylated-alpha-linked acidic dipeptidase